MLRDVVLRMLEVEHINYSIPARFDPAVDMVRDENGLSVAIDYDALRIADDNSVADEVTAAALTWKFRNDLTSDDCNRLALINKLLSQQLRGKNVSTRSLKQALTADEYADYERSLTEPVTTDEILYSDGVPAELKRYNIMLREADFQFYKYESMAGRKRGGRVTYNSSTLSRISYRAEHLYERALEYLQEQVELSERNKDGDRLTRWLDRDVVFGEHSNVSADVDGVPRVKGSRSHSAQDAGLPKMSLRLKREQRVLENLLRAAVACVYVPEFAIVADNIPKLKPLNLANLFPERD